MIFSNGHAWNCTSRPVKKIYPRRRGQTHEEPTTNRQFSFALLARGFCKTCPKCGKGPLLTGYLKPQASCSACKEDFSHISADDDPAWLTLLIFGHAVMPLMLFLGRSDVLPLWLAILILAVGTLTGVYFILPRAKGIFIALIWLTGATGQNEFYDSPDPKD